MLTLSKNMRKKGIGLFGIMVFVGFGISYFISGVGNTAGAMSALSAPASSSQVAGTSYTYAQMSLRDAYPFYITASFMVAGGLSLYAVSYVPGRAARRTQYASRFETWARTTY